MPIRNYSVLKGKPTAGQVVKGRGTHYQITVDADGGPFTIAVNIESFDGSEVLYGIRNAFTPSDPAALIALPSGMTKLPSQPGGLALDFVREQINGAPMVTRDSLTLLPIASAATTIAPELRPDFEQRAAALSNTVTALIANAIAAGNVTLHAFGSAYADAGRVDGIHDIHMNQGNPVSGGHSGDNGTWQDGALFLQTPATSPAIPGTWVAVFLAFQTESWNTGASGNPA